MKNKFNVSKSLLFAAVIILLMTSFVFAQWNPDAGLVFPYSMNATATATSTYGGQMPNNAVDGNPNTFWFSDALLPTYYITNTEFNVILGAGAAGLCTSNSVNDLNLATDGNTAYTSTAIHPVNGEAWYEVQLPSPQVLEKIGIRFYIGAGNLTITANTSSGIQEIAVLNVSDRNTQLLLDAPAESVSSIRVSSPGFIGLNEISVMAKPLYQEITIDFGDLYEVGWIETLNKSDHFVAEEKLSISSDGISWTFVRNIDPTIHSWVTTRLESPEHIRFIKLWYRQDLVDWARVYLYEVRVYDEDGPFGPKPNPVVHPKTLREIIGVNGLWGWGHSRHSNELAPGEGPQLFNRVASHARNYHNLNWDISDPDHIPDYQTMSEGGGTETQYWLNWDLEYGAWRAADLEVQTAIQFLNDPNSNVTFPVEVWDDPYQAAFNYGEAFATHFGPTNGTGHVRALEVGNEPWDYPADFYRTVLRGMAEGAESADPDFKVMPCALQAFQREIDSNLGGNYIGSRVSELEAPFIDVVNTHINSLAFDELGTRIGVQPEHPESPFNRIRNLIRFRDHNLPNLPIYVSEYGWDSDGAGESLHAEMTEGISEYAQALYGVRGALQFSRLGLDRIMWYFFANVANYSGLWGRSGLTGSSNTNFAIKKSFYAFESLVNIIGDRHFIDVIQEDINAWVYLYGEADGTPTHIVAWRPLDVDRDALVPASINLAIEGSPGNAWLIDGESADGTPVILSDPNSFTLEVTEAPLVVEVLLGPGSIVGSVNDEVDPVPNVPIDLYNDEGILIESLETSNEGTFSFVEVDPGDYTIEMIISLGYTAISNPVQSISVQAATETVVDFSLQRKDIIVDARGSGYWKHQVNSLIRDKGRAHETEQDMLDYLQDIKTFWDYFDDLEESLEGLKSVLDLPKKPSMKAKAGKELMSLLLNVASEKIATFNVVSNDDNVGEALVYTILLLDDANSNDDDLEQIKDICEAINNGNLPLDPILIPENLPKLKHSDKSLIQIPTEFILNQNYPNPFNPTTTIEFGLPEALKVSISIFDIHGRIVKELLNEEKPAGFHIVVWNATEKSTGIYLVKMVTEKFTKSIKVSLMK